MSDDIEPPVQLPATMPDIRLDLTPDEKIRAAALSLAVAYHVRTIVSDGQMYQAMQAQGKNLRNSEPQQVINAAVAFEGYLRGHYGALMAEVVAGAVDAMDEAFGQDVDQGGPS